MYATLNLDTGLSAYALYDENKKIVKTFNKNAALKIKKLFKTNWKKFSSKITVLVSCGVHDNVWELWLFIRELPMAAMLNPSLKSIFM